MRADEGGESVSCPTERMRGSEFCEGLIRTRVRIRVRRSCRPARPRPHLALLRFPPLPHRSVGIRKGTKSNWSAEIIYRFSQA